MFRTLSVWLLLALGACSIGGPQWTRVYPSPDAAYVGPPRMAQANFAPATFAGQGFGPSFRPSAFTPSASSAQVEEHLAAIAQTGLFLPQEFRGHFVSCRLWADGMIHYVRVEECQGTGEQIVPIPGPGRCYSKPRLFLTPQACQEALLDDWERMRGYQQMKSGY